MVHCILKQMKYGVYMEYGILNEELCGVTRNFDPSPDGVRGALLAGALSTIPHGHRAQT